MNGDAQRSVILLISCPDRKGIVAAVTDFIARHDGNILHLDQHVDLQQNVFFMRVEWEEKGFALPAAEIGPRFAEIGRRFGMTWDIRFSDRVARLAVFVSREPHCLHEILARVDAGEWNVEIPLVVANHPDLEPLARRFGKRFEAVPVDPGTRGAAEQRQLALLREHRVDLVVLARYMQILSPDFVAAYPNRIINIHHSFLPAFPGAKPYHSAYARGVKIIGATSHYVTADLDTGPIIEQDIIRVSHKDSLADFIRRGKDLEKIVLARAVWRHLQNRILVYNNKTVIFD